MAYVCIIFEQRRECVRAALQASALGVCASRHFTYACCISQRRIKCSRMKFTFTWYFAVIRAVIMVQLILHYNMRVFNASADNDNIIFRKSSLCSRERKIQLNSFGCAQKRGSINHVVEERFLIRTGPTWHKRETARVEKLDVRSDRCATRRIC